jgi:hypothetical protein
LRANDKTLRITGLSSTASILLLGTRDAITTVFSIGNTPGKGKINYWKFARAASEHQPFKAKTAAFLRQIEECGSLSGGAKLNTAAGSLAPPKRGEGWGEGI